MEIIVVAIVLGVVVGLIAQSKGRDFFPWFLYGALIFIVAIVHVLVISSDARHAEARQLDAGGKKCPDCAEIVKADAQVCRFCGNREFSRVGLDKDTASDAWSASLAPTTPRPRPTAWQKLWWNPHA